MASMVRSLFCEIIGHGAADIPQELHLILMGSISMLDAILDKILEEALVHLPAPQAVKGAILGEQPPLSDVCQLMLAQDREDWSTMTCLVEQLDAQPEQVAKCYVDAVKWRMGPCGLMSDQ